MNKKDRRLIDKSLDQPLSKAERSRLTRMLEMSPEARADLQALRGIRAMLVEHGGGEFAPGFSDRVVRRLRLTETSPETSVWETLAGMLWGWRRLSAALAVAVITAAVGLALLSRPTHIEVDFGNVRVVVLPDGSQVELGSGSALTYGRFWPGGQRRVELVGEAYFEVEPAERRFVVETFNANVVVRGTSFNVRAWPDDPDATTEVTVTSGAIELGGTPAAATPSTVEAVAVGAGEVAVARSGAQIVVEPLRMPQARALAWRSGGLAFLDRSLGSAVNELRRRYDVRIELSDPSLALERVTYLQPTPGSVADILADIAFSKQLQFRPIKDGFEIVRAEPTE